MLFPNKTISYNESIISKMIIILEEKESETINVNELYKTLEKKFENIDEFIYALDNLYSLGYIDLKDEDLIYVSWN